jgi:hypothetical protein
MTDIVARLRNLHSIEVDRDLRLEAADEIDRLREQLRLCQIENNELYRLSLEHS